MVNINEEKSVNILTSTDKEKVIKNFSGSINNAIDNNSKDFKELCSVAKEALEHNEISSDHGKFVKTMLDIYYKQYETAQTKEEKELAIQKINNWSEKEYKVLETKNANNKKIIEIVNESANENRKKSDSFIKALIIGGLAFTGGLVVKNKNEIAKYGKELVTKLIDKK